MSNFPDGLNKTPLVGHPLDDVETVECNYCGAAIPVEEATYANKDYMCDVCRDIDISDLAELLPKSMQVITRGSRRDNRASNFGGKKPL